ncbi:uncharacterized protein SPPG_08347 [Spizellomyces punctatus DAOM BR117]|uniref:Uncharacterized protein n=1 Tax=Spizellomyces punctatus (strain DAOM BR117) TaxID=645134 RepID=A0A0L0H654_SPIPD|nr:uncharacterized protein SPPG_08347 [Spizellomyces punctatus DAOM BR117]KNC96193.1 hypothetical protein SPPG_08347 [Spizellomyces punctatus DAOM BR117]|eukprot:XP_016604233.1 hypothetical protein SPPG_08347 [Spizellomyces punctatus DAOM BR117]
MVYINHPPTPTTERPRTSRARSANQRPPRPRITSAPPTRSTPVTITHAIQSSRATSGKSVRTRRDSVFSSWTSRAGSARSAGGWWEGEEWEDGPLAWEPKCTFLDVSEARRGASLPDLVGEQDAYMSTKLRDQDEQDETTTQVQTLLNTRPISSKHVRIAQDIRHSIPSTPNPPVSRPPSSRPRTGRTAPRHESVNHLLRKSIHPETNVDEQSVQREGLYSLLHMGRIPPDANVSKSLINKAQEKLDGTAHLDIPLSYESCVKVAQPMPVKEVIGKPPTTTPDDRETKKEAYPTTEPRPSKVSLVPATLPLPDPLNEIHFVIHKGRTMQRTPAYERFIRILTLDIRTVEMVIEKLESLCQEFHVLWAEVGAKNLCDLAGRPVIWPIKKEDLLKSFVNRQEVESLLRKPGQRYRGRNGEAAAITKLQSWWRSILCRRDYIDRLAHLKAAATLWFYWKMKMKRRMLFLDGQRKLQLHYEQCAQRTQILHKNWATQFKHQRRLVIHIPSTYSSPSGLHNAEVGRLLDMHDATLEVVYIAQTDDANVLDELYKLLHLSFSPSSNVFSRLHIIAPEASHLFQPGSSVAAMLDASPKALKQLRTVMEGKKCFFVTGRVGDAEVRLSAVLNAPILSTIPEPHKDPLPISSQWSFLKSINVPVPEGQVLEPNNLGQWYEAFRELLVENLSVKRWLVMCNGREGVGVIDTLTIATHMGLPTTFSEALESIVQVPRPKDFIINLLSHGGVVHADVGRGRRTVVHCFVEPDGESRVLGMGDEIFDESTTHLLTLFPPLSPPPETAVSHILQNCHDASLNGYITLTFNTNGSTCQCVSVTPYYTRAAAVCQTWLLSTGTRFDGRGKYLFNVSIGRSLQLEFLRKVVWVDVEGVERKAGVITKEQDERMGIWTVLEHNLLANMSRPALMASLREGGIAYDFKWRQGTLFPTVDTTPRLDSLPMLCSGRSMSDCLELVLRNLVVVGRRVSSQRLAGRGNLMDIAEKVGKELEVVRQDTHLRGRISPPPSTDPLSNAPPLYAAHTTPPPAPQSPLERYISHLVPLPPIPRPPTPPIPTPPSPELLSKSIPSHALQQEHSDWNAVRPASPVMPERLTDPTRIPPGMLSPQMYLSALEDQMRKRDQAKRDEEEREALKKLRENLPEKVVTPVKTRLRVTDFMGMRKTQERKVVSMVDKRHVAQELPDFDTPIDFASRRTSVSAPIDRRLSISQRRSSFQSSSLVKEESLVMQVLAGLFSETE